MLKDALAVAGLDFSDEQRQQMLAGVNQNLTRYAELRQIRIDPNIAPPLYYSPLVPGTRLDRAAKPFRPSAPPALRRPANLEDVAFWPLAHLAQLLKTRQVTSVELTRDVSRSAQPLQRHAQLRRHLHRRTGDAAGAAGRRGDRGRAVPRSAARHAVGLQGHHRRARVSDAVGIGRLQGTGDRHRGDRRAPAARGGRGHAREADDRRARVGGPVVRRAHQQPVGSDGGIERIVGRTGERHRRRLRRVRRSAPKRAGRF